MFLESNVPGPLLFPYENYVKMAKLYQILFTLDITRARMFMQIHILLPMRFCKNVKSSSQLMKFLSVWHWSIYRGAFL